MVKLLNETLFDYLEFMYRDKYNYYITMSNLTKLLEHALVKSVCNRNESLAIITGPGILSQYRMAELYSFNISSIMSPYIGQHMVCIRIEYQLIASSLY